MVQKILKNLSKDKILLGLLAGSLLFLLSFPLEKLRLVGEDTKSSVDAESVVSEKTEYKEKLEKELEALIGKVEGAGKVKVMVVLRDAGEKVVEKDVQTESSSHIENGAEGSLEENGSRQENTVMENGQTPWVSQEILPKVEGIAVVIQGGGSAVVQSKISSMLEALFGLPVHKIKVLEGNF